MDISDQQPAQNTQYTAPTSGAEKPKFNAKRVMSIILIPVLFIAFLFVLTPPIAVLIWLLVVKRYRLSIINKIGIFFFCGLVGAFLILAGGLSGLDTGQGNLYVMGIGELLSLSPFIASAFVPGKKHVE